MLVVKSDPYANPKSLSFRFRQKRLRYIETAVAQILFRQGNCRILDIGGEEQYWKIWSDKIANSRIQVDLVNLTEVPTVMPNIRSIKGNACDLTDFGDMSYDLVHSNSVIEHVGTWDNMVRMALNVRRLAPAYFVQTPYFWFPIEPHFRFPIFHWLPELARYRLIMKRELGFMPRANSVSDAVRYVQSASLLDHQQFSVLFPDAVIKFERIFGFAKSLMAVRSGPLDLPEKRMQLG